MVSRGEEYPLDIIVGNTNTACLQEDPILGIKFNGQLMEILLLSTDMIKLSNPMEDIKKLVSKVINVERFGMDKC